MSARLASRCDDEPGGINVTREAGWEWLARQLGMPALLATPACDFNEIAVPASQLNGEKLAALVEIVGPDRVRTDFFERVVHAGTRNYSGALALHLGEIRYVPDAVVYPQTGVETQAAITFAAKNGFAIVPWGGGTLGAGCRRARTIVIDLSRMSQVMANTDVFEAGLCGFEIKQALQASGRRPVINAPDFDRATLGGWIAGSGVRTAGTRPGWLRSAALATPQGLLAFDDPEMCAVLIGSNGAAGIITAARILTRTLPEARETRSFLFRDLESGARIMQQAAQEEAVEVTAHLFSEQEAALRRAFAAQEQHWGEKIGGLYRDVRGFDAGAVTLTITFQGMQSLVDSAVTRAEIEAANRGAMFLRNGSGTRGSLLKYLRPALLERGAGAEEFELEVSWEKLPEVRQRLIGALETALRVDAPHPNSRGLSLSALTSLTTERVLLRLTYIFPRVLGRETEQWERLRLAAQAASPQKDAASRKRLRAVKLLVDPGNILPLAD